jgi:hypothetical protein
MGCITLSWVGGAVGRCEESCVSVSVLIEVYCEILGCSSKDLHVYMALHSETPTYRSQKYRYPGSSVIFLWLLNKSYFI